ncbi:MAG: DinB family protein [Sphingobacteriales bacterium]
MTNEHIILNEHVILVAELIKLLKGGSAHAGIDAALKDLPKELRGARPDKLPYSIWQLVEHIRIAQWDMLEFSKHEKHESPKWPDEYWVKENAPADEATWEKSICQINGDREEFTRLLKNEDIYQPIPHGEGQSILREALQIADHNAYHVAEIIVIRRLLGAWKAS